MKIVERCFERFSQMHPRRQKAAEYFAMSGLGALLAGVAVVPIIEGGSGVGIGVVGVIEGTVGSMFMYKFGHESLRAAREEEDT